MTCSVWVSGIYAKALMMWLMTALVSRRSPGSTARHLATACIAAFWVWSGTNLPAEYGYSGAGAGGVAAFEQHRGMLVMLLLVVHQFWIDGYKDFNFMRASAVVKRQSTFMAS